MRPTGIPRTALVIATIVVPVWLAGCAGASSTPPSASARPAGPSASPSAPVSTATPTGAAPSASAGPKRVEADVDIGGRTLHLTCLGDAPAGTPTVVIETGLGGPSSEWSGIQDTLSATTRICAYDRAGIGQSPSAGQVRTSTDLVADLHAMLQAADIAGPYVLVGHSTGAWQVSLYAATYPDDVVGAIYVDPRNPRTSSRFLKTLGPAKAGEPAAVTAYRDHQTGFEADTGNPEHFALIPSAEEAAAVENGDGALYGSKPVVVLTAGQNSSEFADLPAPIAAAMLADLKKGYEGYLKETSNGTMTPIPDSSHQIFTDDPQAIVDAVKGVLGSVAGG